MSIDPDVARIAKQFGSDPALIQAVLSTDGVSGVLAIEATCRASNHALAAYVSANDAPGFVAFYGARLDTRDRDWPLTVLAKWKRV